MIKRLIFFLFLCLSLSEQPAFAQDWKTFGIEVSVPSEWTFRPDHIDLENSFGMFIAESPNGGYFLLRILKLSDSHDTERPPSDGSATANGGQLRQIENSDDIPGFSEGYIVEKDGVENYFFVSVHNDMTYRFRIGHDFRKMDFSSESVELASKTVLSILDSIRFIEE